MPPINLHNRKKHLIWIDCQQRFCTNNIQKSQSKIGRKIVKKPSQKQQGQGVPSAVLRQYLKVFPEKEYIQSVC